MCNTSEVATAHDSDAPEFTCEVCVAQDFVVHVVLCRSLFVPFLLTYILSVHIRLTASDYYLILSNFSVDLCIVCPH